MSGKLQVLAQRLDMLEQRKRDFIEKQHLALAQDDGHHLFSMIGFDIDSVDRDIREMLDMISELE